MRALYQELQELDRIRKQEQKSQSSRPVRFSITCHANDAISPERTTTKNGRGLTPLHWHFQGQWWQEVKPLVVGFYAYHPRGEKIQADCPDFAILWFKLFAETEEAANKIYEVLTRHRKNMSRRFPMGYIQSVGGHPPEAVRRPGSKKPLPDPANPGQPWRYYTPAPSFRVTNAKLDGRM